MQKRTLSPDTYRAGRCLSPGGTSAKPAKVQEMSTSPLGTPVRFKQPMTFQKAEAPSPSRSDIWKKELGFDDAGSDEAGDEFMTDDDDDDEESNSATEADRKSDGEHSLVEQVLQRELSAKERQKEELLTRLTAQTEKTTFFTRKLAKLEETSKSQMKIVRSSMDSAIREKDDLVSSLQLIISEQEVRIDNMLLHKGGDDYEVQFSISAATRGLVSTIERLQRDLRKLEESHAQREQERETLKGRLADTQSEIAEKYVSKNEYERLSIELRARKEMDEKREAIEAEEKAATHTHLTDTRVGELQQEIACLKSTSSDHELTITRQKRTIASLQDDVARAEQELLESTEKLETEMKAMKKRARDAENKYTEVAFTPPKVHTRTVISQEAIIELAQVKRERGDLNIELMRAKRERDEIVASHEKEQDDWKSSRIDANRELERSRAELERMKHQHEKMLEQAELMSERSRENERLQKELRVAASSNTSSLQQATRYRDELEISHQKAIDELTLKMRDVEARAAEQVGVSMQQAEKDIDTLQKQFDSEKEVISKHIEQTRSENVRIKETLEGEIEETRRTLLAENERTRLTLTEEKREAVDATEKKYAGMAVRLSNVQQLARVLAERVRGLKLEQQSARADLLVVRNAFQPAFKICSNELIGRVEDTNSKMQLLIRRYKREIVLRKRLHNELVELKGNIRVFCRVRPWVKEDGIGDEGQTMVDFDADDDGLLSITSKGVAKTFEMDKVFQPTSTQLEVFNEVRALVTSCLDGYNVCIFAYGQTGSGKTFTMEGTQSNPGLNQRALQLLFEESQAQQDWQFTIAVSVVEIYNEMIRDLLGEDHTAKLEIKGGGTKDGLHVPGLTVVQVSCLEEVNEVFSLGHRNRVTAATNMNEASSRSHSILMVTVYGVNINTNTKIVGKLNLVDLAGSERVSKSGASGVRMKEAQSINKSLSALGDVIHALKNNQQHIPYRNTKLTHLLQESLGGDSKTLMVAQISPVERNVAESVCSLNFAQRVRQVELGPASKKVDKS